MDGWTITTTTANVLDYTSSTGATGHSTGNSWRTEPPAPSGTREPRRPNPTPNTGAAQLEQPTATDPTPLRYRLT